MWAMMPKFRIRAGSVAGVVTPVRSVVGCDGTWPLLSHGPTPPARAAAERFARRAEGGRRQPRTGRGWAGGSARDPGRSREGGCQHGPPSRAGRLAGPDGMVEPDRWSRMGDAAERADGAGWASRAPGWYPHLSRWEPVRAAARPDSRR